VEEHQRKAKKTRNTFDGNAHQAIPKQFEYRIAHGDTNVFSLQEKAKFWGLG
jgi:hypothetical protein